jgi:hypothetical protein
MRAAYRSALHSYLSVAISFNQVLTLATPLCSPDDVTDTPSPNWLSMSLTMQQSGAKKSLLLLLLPVRPKKLGLEAMTLRLLSPRSGALH